MRLTELGVTSTDISDQGFDLITLQISSDLYTLREKNPDVSKPLIRRPY